MNDEIKKQLEENEFDYAVAVATQSEIDNGAACGQLSIIIEDEISNKTD
jgi:adenine C2-methylase RlmN of 23S rRNA A2503 and tRNA A37